MSEETPPAPDGADGSPAPDAPAAGAAEEKTAVEGAASSPPPQEAPQNEQQATPNADANANANGNGNNGGTETEKADQAEQAASTSAATAAAAAPLAPAPVERKPSAPPTPLVLAPASTLREGKVLVVFTAAGAAPILKKSKFKISAHEKFLVVIEFLRSQLKMSKDAALIVYCNRSFAPSPDEIVGDIFASFHRDNKLLLDYAVTPAWG